MLWRGRKRRRGRGQTGAARTQQERREFEEEVKQGILAGVQGQVTAQSSLYANGVYIATYGNVYIACQRRTCLLCWAADDMGAAAPGEAATATAGHLLRPAPGEVVFSPRRGHKRRQKKIKPNSKQQLKTARNSNPVDSD